jgi:hypothetical protein
MRSSRGRTKGQNCERTGDELTHSLSRELVLRCKKTRVPWGGQLLFGPPLPTGGAGVCGMVAGSGNEFARRSREDSACGVMGWSDSLAWPRRSGLLCRGLDASYQPRNVTEFLSDWLHANRNARLLLMGWVADSGHIQTRPVSRRINRPGGV